VTTVEMLDLEPIPLSQMMTRQDTIPCDAKDEGFGSVHKSVLSQVNVVPMEADDFEYVNESIFD